MSRNDENDRLVGRSNRLSIVVHKDARSSNLSCSLQHKLKSLEDATVEEKQDTKPRIQKVPTMLRANEKFTKHYEPMMVAIGPIHHHNPKFEHAEKLKLRLAGHFIKENGLDKEDLCSKITAKMENLKSFYDEEVIKSYNDDDLTWMFLVDNDEFKKLKIRNDQVAFIQRDVFLLENQLPYQVLKLLVRSIVNDMAKRKSVEDSIRKFIGAAAGQEIPTTAEQQSEKNEPHHLLELLRENLIFKPNKRSKGLIDRVLGLMIRYSKQPKAGSSTGRHSFHNVNDLKASAIRLEPSDTISLKDISFHQGCYIGTLRLPPLIVDDSTAPKFLNLIAYEMCPDFMNECEVTSYIIFLDSFITQADDVKEMRKAHILHNQLGSDKEVAQLFNEIGTYLVPNPNLYCDVVRDIENQNNTTWVRWMAHGYNIHFSSPWSITAVIGAITALLLSALQVWYSANNVK